MKIILGIIIILTIFFYPKAYAIFRAKEGLQLSCQCYGWEKGTTAGKFGKDPATRKMCYGIPIKCDTKTMSWWEYIKSDWTLSWVLLTEVVMMSAYIFLEKRA